MSIRVLCFRCIRRLQSPGMLPLLQTRSLYASARNYASNSSGFLTTLQTDLPVSSIRQQDLDEIEKLSYLLPDSPPDSKLLKVAVLGCPNVGKSSLVNAITNFRSCAVSKRVNTTRSKQDAIMTKGNTQVVFVDLPGVMFDEKWFRFDFEKYYMRDIHSAIFAADIIMVVVDVMHIPSRKELHKEIIKALHFFSDKPSILVLNKVDRMKRIRSRLLEMVRLLTEGIVAGTVSHVDKFASKIKQIDTTVNRMSVLSHPKAETLAQQHLQKRGSQSNLPKPSQPWDAEMDKYYVPQINELQEHLVPPSDVLMWFPNPPAPTPLLSGPEEMKHLENSEQLEKDIALLAAPDKEFEELEGTETEEVVDYSSPEEYESRHADSDENEIVEYFSKHPPFSNSKDVQEFINLKKTAVSKLNVNPIVQFMRQQMMLGSVTREEAAARCRLWRVIGERVSGQTAWRNFQEVFMVSAGTGEGVDELRDFLLAIAKPGLWAYHSTMLTDAIPTDVVEMVIWSKCLEVLPKEIPYRVKVEIDDCEKAPDGRIYVSVSLLCRSTRTMSHLLDDSGESIREIARLAKTELQDSLQTNVTVKLKAVRSTIPKGHYRMIKKAKTFSELMPNP